MLDKTSATPLYKQMEDILRENLITNVWIPGQKIPSENELSNYYGISRMTARNVLTKLVQEGLFVRIAGKGTFVNEAKIIAESLYYSGIREQLERLGYQVATKLLSIEKRTVSKNTFEEFNSDPNMEFYVIRRLRSLKGIPFSFHSSYIPALLSPGLEKKELENEQLCVILDKEYGLVHARTVETLESAAASKTEAEVLNIKKGYPLLLLKDHIFDASGELYEYTKVAFLGDRIKLRFEY